MQIAQERWRNFLGRAAVALSPPDTGELDAAQDEAQLGRREHRARGVRGDLWQLERTSFQPLVKNRQPVLIPPEEFQAIAAIVKEDIQPALQHVSSDVLGD